MNIGVSVFAAENDAVRAAVRDLLERKFAEYPDSPVCAAARYASLGDGHCWRPIVAVAAGRIFEEDALGLVLPAACGAELAHAASLILDDLPSMDDAKLRRGRPCVHRVFPQWAVDMAPVFLITMAYDMGLANERVSEDRRVRSARMMSAAGMAMIAGQARDIEQNPAQSPEEAMLECYRLKSGELYGEAARSGAVLCGASDGEAARLHRAGVLIGLSMQFMDDIADVTADVSLVGKEGGKDAGKFTATTWLGVEGAREKSGEFREEALDLLAGFGPQADWFRHLVHRVSWVNR